MDTRITYQQPTLVDLGSVVDGTLGVSIHPDEADNTKELGGEDI
jgi:hypothetical protein